MEYLKFVVQILLIVLAFFGYLKVAEKYGIVDVPNQRSSHKLVTIRGAGIIFFVAILAHHIFYQFPYPYFLIGVTLLVAVSFVDDIISVSPLVRFLCQLLAMFFLFWELEMVNMLQWWCVPLGVFGLAMLNAYNFMDGINGITGIYTLVFLGSLLLLTSLLTLQDVKLIYLMMASILIFGFFNFRREAKVFAGDAGSMSLAFLVLFYLLTILWKTADVSFVLLMAVYGIDSFWTIMVRLRRGEKIYTAHRSHLYQRLSNEKAWPHLKVAMLYGAIQLLLNLLVIGNFFYQVVPGKILLLAVLILLSVVYLTIRRFVTMVPKASDQ